MSSPQQASVPLVSEIEAIIAAAEKDATRIMATAQAEAERRVQEAGSQAQTIGSPRVGELRQQRDEAAAVAGEVVKGMRNLASEITAAGERLAEVASGRSQAEGANVGG